MNAKDACFVACALVTAGPPLIDKRQRFSVSFTA